jgi:hypothetical protein
VETHLDPAERELFDLTTTAALESGSSPRCARVAVFFVVVATTLGSGVLGLPVKLYKVRDVSFFFFFFKR